MDAGLGPSSEKSAESEFRVLVPHVVTVENRPTLKFLHRVSRRKLAFILNAYLKDLSNVSLLTLPLSFPKYVTPYPKPSFS